MSRCASTLAILISLFAHGQGRNNNLVFAHGIWLSFWGDSLAWQNSTYQPSMRNACMSDPYGNFLLLVDDRGIRNSFFIPMAGGDSIELGWTMVSSAYVILPKPGDPQHYLVFRNEAEGERRGGVTEVDITGNGGFGEVTSPTAWYTTNTTSKLVASPHANGSDYWLLQHTDGTDTFEAWLLDSNGLQPVPVVSHTGGSFVPTTFPTSHPDFSGPMKMSVLGDRLALAKLQGSLPDTSIVEIFDFDPWTGDVQYHSNVNTTCWRYASGAVYDFIPMRWMTGIEFAQDGMHLYLAAWDTLDTHTGNNCWQYSMADMTPEAIQTSGTRVCGNGNGVYGLLSDASGSQLLLAANGSIYGRQVSTDPNEVHPLIWSLTNLPVPIIPVTYNNNLTYFSIETNTGGSGGFPGPCKRYHDSEPIWLGTTTGPELLPPLSAVPNPVVDRASLYLSGRPVPDELRWTDATGRVVRTSRPLRDGPTVVIDRSGIADGLYTVIAIWNGRVLGNVRVICQ